MTYNVVVVDDQNIPRKLFEMVVNSSSRYRLMYSLDSAAVAHVICERFDVDLVIMDIVMADGSNGLDAAKRIKKHSPGTKILIVTSMVEEGYLKRARDIGIESFWYKETTDSELIEIMDRTMAGESVFPESPPDVMIGQIRSNELTPAETDVLREMTTGASNQEIADDLGISIGTVKTHISRILSKTGCPNRTALAIEARMRGLGS
jgi:two-component system vancomycin resistance associated response regulator VraR